MSDAKIQIRTKSETNRIHIQGIGDVSINRDYGFATKLRAPEEIVNWLSKQEPTEKSAATDGIYYVKAEVVVLDVNKWRILIHGEPALNTPYGALIGLSENSNANMVIDFITQNDVTCISMEEE